MANSVVIKVLLFIFFGYFTSCSEDDISSRGREYYVSTDGNDNNPGTKEKPWATWNKAFNSVTAGDMVYFRGGVYMMPPSAGAGYTMYKNGTITDTIFFMNYPGEVPILDCGEVEIDDGHNHRYGILLNANYIKFKGLTIRNIWQLSGEDEVEGIGVYRSSGVIIENCTVYNTHGCAFKAVECDDTYFINCDAYNNCDSLTTVPIENPMPGNDGTGFMDFNLKYSSSNVYFRNCRAWNCGDQGFTSGSIGYTEYDGCWSFRNGQLEGEGHGFKMGWIESTPLGLKRLYKNCIAVYNRTKGFTTNDQGYHANSMQIYNNIAYHNGYYIGWTLPSNGFYIYNTIGTDEAELSRVYKNNIAYMNEDGDIGIGYGSTLYTHAYNSWDVPPGISITDSDFISLDSLGISGPRQVNGSLPDLDFLKLAKGSDLIDAGINVGLPFLGKAPDLGAFERD